MELCEFCSQIVRTASDPSISIRQPVFAKLPNQPGTKSCQLCQLLDRYASAQKNLHFWKHCEECVGWLKREEIWADDNHPFGPRFTGITMEKRTGSRLGHHHAARVELAVWAEPGS